MRNLPLPSRNDVDKHLKKSITTYKYKGKTLGRNISNAEVSDVIAIYDEYDIAKGSARDALKGDALAPDLREAIYNAYDKTQERRKLYSIRETLFANVTLCPICGIDPVTELDHHLPRSIFSPLAIYTRNLIPVCHLCNNTKLAGFGDQSQGEVAYLHAYFDTLPDVNFLKAVVTLQGSALQVNFEIKDHALLPDGYSERLSDQIRNLKLNARYQDEVNTYITSHTVALHLSYVNRDKQAVRKFLSAQAKVEETAFYRNHWRPTLLFALAGSDEFIDGGFAKVLPVAQEILDDIQNG